MRKTRRRLAASILVVVLVPLLCAGCGFGPAASGNTSIGSSTTSAMPGMSRTGSSGGASTPGVPMAMPIVTIGQAKWQGMDIDVRTMAPVPFVVFNGTSMRTIKPTKQDNMHLMVTLTDALTHVPIPYATVWATIKRNAKIIFDQRQWPMLSRYMGVHYGNNVPLHGAGEYTLDLLIGPPVAARHMEYAHVWLKPHDVQFTFHWKPGM